MKNWLVNKILHSYTASKLLKKEGKRIVHYPYGELKRIIDLLGSHTIDLILDVGANEGQYAGFVRSIGYKGNIVSFEPLTSAFSKLQANSQADGKRENVNIALGDKNYTTIINIAGNSQSSSLMDMNNTLLSVAPETAYIGTEEITVKTLDSIYNNYCSDKNNVFLKIDVQGFEKQVLDGAKRSLAKIKGLQLEMSFEELYTNEMLFSDMIAYVKALGFHLCAIKNGFSDVKTGKLLQADGIFFRIDNA